MLPFSQHAALGEQIREAAQTDMPLLLISAFERRESGICGRSLVEDPKKGTDP